MPLQTLKAQIRVESVAVAPNGPQGSYDTFTEDSTTMYDTDATHAGAGVATGEYGDYRTIAVAGNEDFDLANVSTPLTNREREQLVFSRVMMFYLKNYSTTATIAYNKGPNPCGLPSGTLNPGEDTAFRSGVGGVGVAITPGSASGFRITSSANDAIYSIFFAGQTTRALAAAALAASGTVTATPSLGVSASASLAAVASALGTPAVAGSASASLAAVASIPFAASHVSFPP